MNSPSTSSEFLETDGSEDGVATVFLWIIFLTVLISILTLYIRIRLKSTRPHPKTSSPKSPDWMLGMLASQRILSPVENGKFSIATKSYTDELVVRSGVTVEKSKPIIEKMKKMLPKLLGISRERVILPNSTCIISIPKRNFRCGSRHAEFVPLNGGPSGSYFEYQMIGDDRIQVTYYVVKGIRYVAGICVYIENPYNRSVYYSESTIRRLLNEPDYWSNHELEEETTSVVRRKSNYEHVLITKNRYGDVKHSIFHGESKSFKSEELLPLTAYITNPEREDLISQAKFLKVRICDFLQKIVMISERDDHKFHAVWNQRKEKIEYFECSFCDQPDDAPPPSYYSIMRSKMRMTV